MYGTNCMRTISEKLSKENATNSLEQSIGAPTLVHDLLIDSKTSVMIISLNRVV